MNLAARSLILFRLAPPSARLGMLWLGGLGLLAEAARQAFDSPGPPMPWPWKLAIAWQGARMLASDPDIHAAAFGAPLGDPSHLAWIATLAAAALLLLSSIADGSFRPKLAGHLAGLRLARASLRPAAALERALASAIRDEAGFARWESRALGRRARRLPSGAGRGGRL